MPTAKLPDINGTEKSPKHGNNDGMSPFSKDEEAPSPRIPNRNSMFSPNKTFMTNNT